MNLLELLSDGPILIVLTVFIFSILFCCIKYFSTYHQLNKIIKFISGFKKSDLNFKFKELDTYMNSNPYVAAVWGEFKNTLVFSESVALKDGNEFQYQDVSSTVQNVQTTVDPLYFFNEDTLITSKFNYRLMQAIPTVLTGFGPLFTFLKIAMAFGLIDFSSQEKTVQSVASFMISMQAAALVSVIAVSTSLIFLMFERILYNAVCKAPLTKIQNIMGELFASISSEKFLYELLRESKISTNASSQLISTMPDKFKIAFNETMAANLVPYLENVIFGLNQLNKEIKQIAKAKSGGEDIDNLF